MNSNMQYQQVLEQMTVGFIVLSAHNNKLETLIPLMEQVRTALESLQVGQVVRISKNNEI